MYTQGVGAGTLWLMLLAGLLGGGFVIYVAVRIALLQVLDLRDKASRVSAETEQDEVLEEGRRSRGVIPQN